MPKDDISAPGAPVTDPNASADNDDEVIDLLEVVKPGKPVPNPAADDDVDFSADLNSMLDTLSKAEQSHSEENDAFPDPTPVDHEVDANESLDLPGMDDLDSILNSLGAATEQSAPKEAPSAEPAPGIPDLDAVPAAAPELPVDADDLLAELGVAAPAPQAPAPAPEIPVDADDLLAELGVAAPAPQAPAPAPEVPVDADDLLAELGVAAPAPQAPAPAPEIPVDADDLLAELGIAAPAPQAPAPAPEVPVDADDLLAELGVAAPAPQAPAPAPEVPVDADDLLAELGIAAPAPEEIDMAMETAAGDISSEALEMAGTTDDTPETLPDDVDADDHAGSRLNDVDLNELDALLDDMLATAPASGPVPPSAEPAAVAPAPVAASAADATEPAALREEVEELKKLVTASSTLETEVNRLGAAIQEHTVRLDDIAMTLSVQAEARPAAEQPDASEELAFLGEQTANILSQQQDICKRLESLEQQLSDLSGTVEQVGALADDIDKVAAEAAARIIREELAALLESGL